jgi:hypothetical protein
MSIFEPIPRESGWDEDAQEFDDARWDEGPGPTAGFDPRSITIAGLVVIAIVIAGLVASNAADPSSRPEPLVPARVNPGAAAVEQVEAKQSAPTADPSASPSAESVDESDGDAQVDDGTDAHASGDSKRDSKPGKGHGNGHGRG